MRAFTTLIAGFCLISFMAACSVTVNDNSMEAPAAALSTPDDAVFMTIELWIKPAELDSFVAMMTEAAVDTRAWDGCQLFDIYVDDDKPGRVLFYEIWDSKEQQAAHAKWRQDTGFNATLGPFLAGGVEVAYLTKVDG